MSGSPPATPIFDCRSLINSVAYQLFLLLLRKRSQFLLARGHRFGDAEIEDAPEWGSLLDRDSDEHRAAGTVGSGGIIDEAMATLLKAIRDLTQRGSSAHAEVPAQSPLRAEWDQIRAACRAAAEGGDDEEGDAAMLAAGTRVNDCARRILKAPVGSMADIRLLAEAVHWVLWTDPAGITDENLAAGPSHELDEASDEALAALLRGIRDFT